MSREVGPADVTAYLAIRRHAADLGIDVLHGHGAKGGAYARLVARSLRRTMHSVVCCYTPHGGSLHYHPASVQGRIYMMLERRLAAHTDALIFESAYSADRYKVHVGAPACSASIVPNGLTPADFTAQPPGEAAVDFLFVGELRRLKGVDVMLTALAQVRTQHPIRAAIVGAGPDCDAFKQDAARLDLSSVVTFRPPMPAHAAFRLGRTLVVPSRAESFPYIVLEAAAAGIPLLATNVGGIPEIVDGTGTALLPAGDPDALAEAMREVLRDPAGAQRRADQLRAEVSRRFTVSVMTDRILALYASALARIRSARN